jgi:hypothetical protein
MPTDVVQDPNMLVVVPEEDQTCRADIEDRGVSSFGNIAFKADIDPVLAEEHVKIRLKDVFARVEAGW